MKIYLDNNLGVTNVEQEELTQDTIGYNILKVYIPNAVLTPYDTFTCYYGALLQNGRKVGWFAMEARTNTDADYEANYTLYKATLEQCVVSVEGKVYIGCQVLLGNSGNATLIKKNTAVVQFNVRKSVAINNDILVLDTDQTTTDVLESYKNLLENALTTYATKATTYTKTEVDGKLDLKADKSDTYTKTQVDSALLLKADKSNTYTKTEVDTALNNKADKSDTYTKAESDTKFALKSTAVTHDGNQLKDNNGNNIYPKINEESIDDKSVNANKFDNALQNVLFEKVNNIVRTSSNNNNALNISGVVTPVSPSYHTNVYDVSGENVIYVNATTLYPNPNYCDYCFTDENDTIISYYQNGTKGVSYSLDTFINVPSNAKYFKLSIVNSTFGNEQVLSLIKISQKLNKDIYDKLINDSFNTVNLYDKYNTNDGYSLSGGNGALTVDANRLVTDFVEVDYTKSLYAIGGAPTSIVCLYNENKGFVRTLIYNLNGQTPTLIDLSSYSNCKYIRISIELTYKDKFILSEFPTNYPYGKQCIKLENIENSSNILLNHWMGKNGDSLGDSITAQGHFQKAVSSILNLDMYYNHGIGGTKITGNDDNSMHKDVRINALNENADFITIMGGTNDGDVSIGNITLSNIDTDTYVGALNTIISKIYYKYAHTSINNGVDYSGITQTTNAKNIKIFVMTPTFTGTDSTGRFINQSNAIRELCKLWGIPVIDLSGKSGMNFGTINYCFNGTDLVHPIEQCHYDMIAPVIVNELLDNPIVNYDNLKISKRFA